MQSFVKYLGCLVQILHVPSRRGREDSPTNYVNGEPMGAQQPSPVLTSKLSFPALSCSFAVYQCNAHAISHNVVYDGVYIYIRIYIYTYIYIRIILYYQYMQIIHNIYIQYMNTYTYHLCLLNLSVCKPSGENSARQCLLLTRQELSCWRKQ